MDEARLSIDSDARSREYKARNILSLEERVQVIRAYNSNPIYQRIAEQFNCSAKQIKNIIASKEAVLSYVSSQTDDKAVEAQRRRQQKVIFLGKVIYEFIQRAVYHGMRLSTDIVRQKALDVKESIAIENFYPTNVWLQNFKSHYKIPEFNTTMLAQCLKFQKPKRDSFKCIDLIQYVSRHEKEQQTPFKDENDNSAQGFLMASKGNCTPIQNEHIAAPTVVNAVKVADGNDRYEDEGDDAHMLSEDDTQDVKFVYSDDEDIKPEITYIKTEIPDVKPEFTEFKPEIPAYNNSATLAQQLSPLTDIGTCLEALRHLKVLEDFAMLSENYRAIGLISQLEEVFKNPPARSDFENE